MTETTVNSNRDPLGMLVNLIQINLSAPNSSYEQTIVCSTIGFRFSRQKAKRSSRFARKTGGIRIEFTGDSIDCSAFASLQPSFAPLRASSASLRIPSHQLRLSSPGYQ